MKISTHFKKTIVSDLRYLLLDGVEPLTEITDYLNELHNVDLTNNQVRYILKGNRNFARVDGVWDLTLKSRYRLIEEFVIDFVSDNDGKSLDELVEFFEDKCYSLEEDQIIKAIDRSDCLHYDGSVCTIFTYEVEEPETVGEKPQDERPDINEFLAKDVGLKGFVAQMENSALNLIQKVTTECSSESETVLVPPTQRSIASFLDEGASDVQLEEKREEEQGVLEEELLPEELYPLPKPRLAAPRYVDLAKKINKVIQIKTKGTYDPEDDEHSVTVELVRHHFGYHHRIIDNDLEPDERSAFYLIQNITDDSVFRELYEETTLWDGRDWRIFYWFLDEEKMDKVIDEFDANHQPVLSEEESYNYDTDIFAPEVYEQILASRASAES